MNFQTTDSGRTLIKFHTHWGVYGAHNKQVVQTERHNRLFALIWCL